MYKLVITREDKLKSWEDLINAVDKSDIPLKFVGNVNIVFKEPVNGANERDISIHSLRFKSLSEEEIEQHIEDFLAEHDSNIQTVNFYINIELVAAIAQRHTDFFLKGTQ